MEYPKCCPLDQYLGDFGCSEYSSEEIEHQLEVEVFSSNFSVNTAFTSVGWASGAVYQKSEDCMHFPLMPSEKYYLLDNRSLYVNHGDDTSIYPWDSYCFDRLHSNINNTGVLICAYGWGKSNINEQIIQLGMFISLPCLLAVLLVYGCFRELRNVQGKIVMSLVSTLFTAFVVLIGVQNVPYFTYEWCVLTGYAIMYVCLTMFSWFQIMGFDLWREVSRGRSQQHRNKFLFYSLYAWGVPFIIVSIAAVLQGSLPTDSEWNPNIGEPSCFLESFSAIPFFYVPLGVALATNLVIFINLAFRVSVSSQGTNVERLCTYLKLFIVMGLFWSGELLSAAFYKDRGVITLWSIVDIINCLQGVFIALVLLSRKRVRKLISCSKKRSRNASTDTEEDEPENQMQLISIDVNNESGPSPCHPPHEEVS